MAKLMKDPKVRKEITVLYKRMMAEGVNIRDEEAVKKWIVAHKAELEKSPPEDSKPQTVVRQSAKIGRNDPCPCGSGKKYKKCCLNKSGK